MLLKTASGHYDVAMVDSSSDQKTLVHFPARTFHTISHQPSAS